MKKQKKSEMIRGILCLLMAVVLGLGMFSVYAASSEDQIEEICVAEADVQEGRSAEKAQILQQGRGTSELSGITWAKTASSAAEIIEEDTGLVPSPVPVETEETADPEAGGEEFLEIVETEADPEAEGEEFLEIVETETADPEAEEEEFLEIVETEADPEAGEEERSEIVETEAEECSVIVETETEEEEFTEETEEDPLAADEIICDIPHVMARVPEVPENLQAPEHHKHLNYAKDTSVSIPGDIGFREGDSGGAHHDEEGWYDLSLDVTGGETTWSDTPKGNIIFIVDNSNSMKLAPYMDPNARDENGNPLFTRINSRSEDPNEQEHDADHIPPEHYVLKDGVLWPAYAFGDTDGWGNTNNYWCLVSDASETYDWFDENTFYNTKRNTESALYEYSGPTRMQAAQVSLNEQLELIKNSGIDSQISVVSFGSQAQVLVRNSPDIGAAESAIAGLQPNGGGTNWDDALQKAKGIETRAGVPTYVVFISDGNPTFYGSGPSGNGQESDTNNVEISWQAAKATAEAFLDGKEDWSFYSVAAFNTQIFHMSDDNNGIAWPVYGGEAPDGHVYTASQADDFTTALSNIIEDIKAQAKKTTGHYSKAAITDTLSALVDAREGSLSYTVSRIVNGTEETIAFAPGAGTVTFSDGKVVNVPAGMAVLDGKNLTWDLGSDFELHPGATFAVHLKVRPDQLAHDLSAADKNGDSIETTDVVLNDSGKPERNSVDDMMIYANSGTPTVSYKDPQGKEGSSEYTEKPQLPVPYSKISIEKVWKTDKPDNITSITVDLLQDGNTYKTFTLSADNQWKAQALVPAGPVGHAYQLQEETVLGDGWTASYSYSGYDKEGEVNGKEADQVTFDSPCSLEQREGAFTIRNARQDTSAQVEIRKVWKDADGNVITDTDGLWATFELWRRKTQKPQVEKKQYTVTVKTRYFLGSRGSRYGSTNDSGGRLAEGPSKTITVTEGDTLPFTITVTGEDGQMGIYSSSVNGTALTGEMSDPTGGIFTINGTYGQSLYRSGSYQLVNITGDTTVEITLLGMVKVNGYGWFANPSINDSVSISFGTPVTGPDPDPVFTGDEKVPGVQSVTMQNGTWSHVWDKLPAKDADGNLYSYYVKETGCSPEFKLEGIDNNGGITNGTITAANKQTSTATTSISVEKVWDDNDNHKGIRPENVTVRLYRNGEQTDQTKVLSAGSDWKAQFTDLPILALVTKDGSNSWQQISYSVKEENVPDGYIASSEQNEDGSWTVTNKLVYTLPNTAGPGSYMLWMCGTALITAALLFEIEARRKGDS